MIHDLYPVTSIFTASFWSTDGCGGAGSVSQQHVRARVEGTCQDASSPGAPIIPETPPSVADRALALRRFWFPHNRCHTDHVCPRRSIADGRGKSHVPPTMAYVVPNDLPVYRLSTPTALCRATVFSKRCVMGPSIGRVHVIWAVIGGGLSLFVSSLSIRGRTALLHLHRFGRNPTRRTSALAVAACVRPKSHPAGTALGIRYFGIPMIRGARGNHGAEPWMILIGRVVISPRCHLSSGTHPREIATATIMQSKR